MLGDQSDQRRQFRTPKSHVGGQGDGAQPELRVSLGLFHMDVRRLLPLIAEEEEPEASNAEDRRHSGNLPATGERRQPGPLWAR